MKLFIFGSTGDLVKRKVLSGLQNLNLKELEVYALGRKDLNHDSYKEFACSENCSEEFKEKINYIEIDYDSDEICNKCLSLIDKQNTNYFYLALPPGLYSKILVSIGKLKKLGYKVKILVEKPFGESLENAEKLVELVNETRLREDMFIADHYLFKQGIYELIDIGFESLMIGSLETIGLEGRIGYYNEIGALKDMVQSHLLNLLFKIAGNLDFKDIEIKEIVKGQYGNGKGVGYLKELGKKSDMETFIYILMLIKGKKIKIVSGKALNKKEVFIEVNGKKIIMEDPHNKSYTNMFQDFFRNKRERFPSLENTLIAWRIIDKINSKGTRLVYYDSGSSFEDVVKKANR